MARRALKKAAPATAVSAHCSARLILIRSFAVIDIRGLAGRRQARVVGMLIS
jgi:hypothetical protein